MKEEPTSPKAEGNGENVEEQPEVKKEVIEEKKENVVKTEIKVEPENNETRSLLDTRIIRQIEYYFGDINLSKDKFLREKVKEDDGWVPLEVMLKFNRLATLSTDVDVILGALAKSDSGLMEVSEDKLKIRRSPNKPLPEMNESRRKEMMGRSIYVKGFPGNEETKMDDLIEFFYNYGSIDNIIMRHYHDKASKKWIFKGSIFVIFKTIEDAEAFLKVEDVKYKGMDLIRKWQNDYVEEKRKERMDGRKKKHGKKEKDGENEEDGDGDDESSVGKKEKEVSTGCVIKVSNMKPDMMRENIKKAVEEFGFPVAFVDFRKGEDSGWVRLDDQDSAVQLVKKLEEEGVKLKVDGEEITVEALEGEEEEAYLEKLKQIFAKSRNMGKNRKRGKFGGGRGRGGWNNRKRKGDHFEGGTPAKVKAE